MHRSALNTLSKLYPDEVKQILDLTKNCIPLTPTYRYKFLKKGYLTLKKCCNPDCDKTIGHYDKISCLSKSCVSYSIKQSNLKKYGVECVFQNEEIKIKIKKTTLERYGVSNPSQSELIKKKKIVSYLKKYGVENPSQSELIKKKTKNTNLEKYGCSNVFQNEVIKLKIKKSNLIRYGVENPSQSKLIKAKKLAASERIFGVPYVLQSEIVKNKIKNTNLIRYGYPNVFQNEIIKLKIKKTNLERYDVECVLNSETIKRKIKITNIKKYGFEHPMQCGYIADKSLKNSYTYKIYTWRTGEKSIVQGYEPIILNELEEEGYTYLDVLTNKSDMPIIMYLDEIGINRRYYPDIYIPSENLILEVKSEYTYLKNFYINNIKFLATKKLGFNIKVEVR